MGRESDPKKMGQELQGEAGEGTQVDGRIKGRSMEEPKMYRTSLSERAGIMKGGYPYM